MPRRHLKTETTRSVPLSSPNQSARYIVASWRERHSAFYTALGQREINPSTLYLKYCSTSNTPSFSPLSFSTRKTKGKGKKGRQKTEEVVGETEYTRLAAKIES